MLRKVRLIQVFLAAPGDVVEEQGIVSRIINDWNISIGKSHSAHAELIQWKTHSHPEFGDRPQAIINRQALDDCDIVVGIFWSRFGTPTGHAQSGTEEEIRRSISSGKKVLLYFSDRLMSPSHINQEQYTRIVAFKQEFGDKGLFWTYSTLEQFERDFRTHISTVLTEKEIPLT